jgi:hypothetical protein
VLGKDNNITNLFSHGDSFEIVEGRNTERWLFEDYF